MSDSANDIGFKVFAVIDGLKESMGQAGLAVKGFAEETNQSIEKAGGAFEALNSTMLKFAAVLAGGAFFKEAITSTVEWTEAMRGLSKQFGITLEEASGLAMALDDLGIGTEQYRGAASKLDRQVRSNEETVNALGVATRSTTGTFLSQQEIMMNAINGLREYKEGTDRNIAAQYLFGRGADDAAKLLRLTNEAIEQGTEDAQKFGLEVGDNSAAQIRRYKLAINEVHDAFEGIQRVIGTALIPTLTSLGESFTSTSAALRTVEIAVKTLATAFIGLQTIAIEVADGIGTAFAIMTVKFQSETEQLSAYATLNFTKAREAAQRGQELLNATIKEGGDQMARDMEAQAQRVGQIWNIGGVNDEAKNKAPTTEENKPSKTVPGDLDGSAAKAASKENVQIAQMEAATKQQLSRIALQDKKDALAEEVAAGRMSAQEQIDATRRLVEEEYRLEREAITDAQGTNGLTLVEQKKLYDQLLVLKAKHEQDMHRLSLQRLQAERAQFGQYFSAINNGFKGMITGVLQGTQTWQQAMQNMFSNILVSFAGFLAEKAAKWAENQLFELIFGKATAQAGAVTEVGASAAAAGAAAYASTAAIPIIGPILAPASAAAAYAGALAFGATIPAAENGFDIPAGVNPLTQLHQREMVLPAELADGVRGMVAGGGGGGGDMHLHVHAVDSRGVERLLMDNGKAIAAAMRREMRNANPNTTKG